MIMKKIKRDIIMNTLMDMNREDDWYPGALEEILRDNVVEFLPGEDHELHSEVYDECEEVILGMNII